MRNLSGLPFRPLPPTSRDELTLADGFQYNIIGRWGDRINPDDTFGTHCDFLAYVPIDPTSLEGTGDGLLWVNNEYLHPLMVTGTKNPREKRSKAKILEEQKQVGGTIVRVRRDLGTGEWKMIVDDRYNRRIDARTQIPFAWDRPIAGQTYAIGTLGNCGGGVTPWRTILTCEENNQEFYGERDYTGGKAGGIVRDETVYGWDKVFSYPPEHYGWVVEVNPLTGVAKKLVALGRFGHESATVAVARDGRCVVYSGDDANDRCLYKFIADQPGSLERGTLYVADIENGKWISLRYDQNPTLKKYFEDQTEVLVRARYAALMLGGTPLDRPEDIDIDPLTGAVYVSLTNNIGKNNHYGSILKLVESGTDPLSLSFKATNFMAGGPETGFACPDNLAFDPHGGLWVTSDISGSVIGKPPYEKFGNNGLFYVPTRGKHAGRVLQVASAPMDAELTGQCFAPDGKTLFLSVQHPGEQTASLDRLTSNWPDGGKSKPRSSVVAITGDAMEKILAGAG